MPTSSIISFSGPFTLQDDGRFLSVEKRGLGGTPRKSSLEIGSPKEIAVWKRKRTLKLLRRYIPTVDIVGDSGSPAPANLHPLEDSNPSSALRRYSSGAGGYGTSSRGGPTPLSALIKAFFITDSREIEHKTVGHLPECLKARKALMKYIGDCENCSRKRIKCLLTHHAFRNLLNDPTISDQARADIEWVYKNNRRDAVIGRFVLAEAYILTDLQISPNGYYQVSDMGVEPFHSTHLSSVEAYSDSSFDSIRKLETGNKTPRSSPNRVKPQDSVLYRPLPSLMISQSSPGGPITFLPSEGTLEFLHVIQNYDETEISLEEKISRIIADFKEWRESYCLTGAAMRRLDATPSFSSAGLSKLFGGNEDELTSNEPVQSSNCVGCDDDDARSLVDSGVGTSLGSTLTFVSESVTDVSDNLTSWPPTRSEILRAYISFAQHPGVTLAPPTSGTSSGFQSSPQAHNGGKSKSSQNTSSLGKRGRGKGDDPNDSRDRNRKSNDNGTLDGNEAEGHHLFICPIFAFSLIMRYTCTCSHKSFKYMNSLRYHILNEHSDFYCKNCHEIFPTRIELAGHNEDGCKKKFICRGCLKGFLTENEHHWCQKVTIYRCGQCLQRFPSEELRVEHTMSGCETTPSPEFQIVDYVLHDEIEKSLVGNRGWSFETEQDDAKRGWILNNVHKFFGELPDKQRALVKWIGIWNCFPFIKPMPDSPFRDMTIPTSDVQISEIIRKLRDDLRHKIEAGNHPLSPDIERQQVQTDWFVESALETLEQFANIPRRSTIRRAEEKSQSSRLASGEPTASNAATLDHFSPTTSAIASGTKDIPRSYQTMQEVPAAGSGQPLMTPGGFASAFQLPAQTAPALQTPFNQQQFSTQQSFLHQQSFNQNSGHTTQLLRAQILRRLNYLNEKYQLEQQLDSITRHGNSDADTMQPGMDSPAGTSVPGPQLWVQEHDQQQDFEQPINRHQEQTNPAIHSTPSQHNVPPQQRFLGQGYHSQQVASFEHNIPVAPGGFTPSPNRIVDPNVVFGSNPLVAGSGSQTEPSSPGNWIDGEY